MNDEALKNTAALALATHALLIKLIAVLKADGVISSSQLQDALSRALAILEEGADPIGLRARVMLETVADSFGLD